MDEGSGLQYSTGCGDPTSSVVLDGLDVTESWDPLGERCDRGETGVFATFNSANQR